MALLYTVSAFLMVRFFLECNAPLYRRNEFATLKRREIGSAEGVNHLLHFRIITTIKTPNLTLEMDFVSSGLLIICLNLNPIVIRITQWRNKL